jgi:hypothetical protein
MPRTKHATPIYPGRVWTVGLANAAKRLGCSANHLRLVLTGERRSDRVLTGYKALEAELATTKRKAA